MPVASRAVVHVDQSAGVSNDVAGSIHAHVELLACRRTAVAHDGKRGVRRGRTTSRTRLLLSKGARHRRSDGRASRECRLGRARDRHRTAGRNAHRDRRVRGGAVGGALRIERHEQGIGPRRRRAGRRPTRVHVRPRVASDFRRRRGARDARQEHSEREGHRPHEPRLRDFGMKPSWLLGYPAPERAWTISRRRTRRRFARRRAHARSSARARRAWHVQYAPVRKGRWRQSARGALGVDEAGWHERQGGEIELPGDCPRNDAEQLPRSVRRHGEGALGEAVVISRGARRDPRAVSAVVSTARATCASASFLRLARLPRWPGPDRAGLRPGGNGKTRAKRAGISSGDDVLTMPAPAKVTLLSGDTNNAAIVDAAGHVARPSDRR